MARIFRQKYTQPTTDGKRKTRQSAKWYVEYRDSDGIRRRVPGFRDKSATQQLAAELERNTERQLAGLGSPCDSHLGRPLTEHVEAWRQALVDKGATATYGELSARRVRAVLDGTRSRFWRELSTERVLGYLAERRRDGLSVESSNHYIRRMKQFSRWMQRTRRAPEHILAGLEMQNSSVDRRHDRRALSNEELRRLLEATRRGPIRFGMNGTTRAVLYELAATTGLRVAELRSLDWGSFDLNCDPPTVSVRAAYTKHRRDDVLPLKPSTARLLVGLNRCAVALTLQGLAPPLSRRPAFHASTGLARF